MNEHYASDPAYGCGLLIVYLIVVVVAFLVGFFLLGRPFGFPW
jgi:hypothetical protein